MRAIVMSDSHRSEGRLRELLQRLWSFTGRVDLYIHLGDGADDFDAVAGDIWARDPLAGRIGVRGNCDFACSEPMRVITDFGRSRLLITHGHLYGVKQETGRIAAAAAGEGCAAALFGHTHRPLCEERDGILLLNPGSAHDGNIALLESSPAGRLAGRLYHFD